MQGRFRTVIAVALALASGCVPRAEIRPTSPFTSEMARHFDDSVDYISNLDDIGGRLGADFRTQLEFLARQSDLVAITRIETVTVSQDPDGTQSYRLTAEVLESIRGQVPEGNRVGLRATQGQPGYNTVQGRQERLSANRWLLFVKWYIDGVGDVRPHWHLSPATDALVRRIRILSGTVVEDGFRRVVPSSGS
jgi:hypothetical protein